MLLPSYGRCWPATATRKGNATLALVPLLKIKLDPGGQPDPSLVEWSASPHVRACRIGDVPRLRGVDEIQILNQPETLLTPYSALRHGVQSVLPVRRERPRVFVARVEQDVIGFVDLQPVPPDQRWHLTAIGTSPSAHRAAAMEALLRYGVMAAGAQGVKRLYARSRPELVVCETARSLGFSPYAEEIVFAARSSSFRPAPTKTRAQEQSDTWAIHQLYNATVPRDVQYAEAFTSHFWDVDARRALGAAAVHGRVIEDGHRLSGYVRVASHAGTHVIELVAAPDQHDVAGSLLDAALSDIGRRRVKRVYCAIRTYQQHLRQPLEDRGFVAMWTQQLQVKYTTAAVRAPASDPVLLYSDVRERVPKRVPTFLQGHEQDGSARLSR